jgi:small subunit ribosomal protein S7
MVLEKKKVMYLMRKFVNHIMVEGKKTKAERVFEKSLFFVKLKERQNPVLIFLKALNFSKAFVEVRSVRRGGATYQIPVPLKEKRAISLSMKWILQAAKKKKGVLSLNLASILVEASKSQGESVKKKESIHLTALKNRSLTHFRWF